MVLRREERGNYVSSQNTLLITTCSVARTSAAEAITRIISSIVLGNRTRNATKRFAKKKMLNWGLSRPPSMCVASKL